MASPLYKMVVKLHRSNGVPADDVINVWHFEGDEGGTSTDEETRWNELLPGLVSRLETFYNGISVYFSRVLSGECTIQAINMRDPRPVYARQESTFTLPQSQAVAPLPSEVALCLSFEGAKEPGAVMRRRRGRVYLGPFNDFALDTAPIGGDSRPILALREAVLNEGLTMATGEPATGAARLAIFSPTEAGPLNTTADAAWNDAVRLWLDDAWDTQRRRGAVASRRDERVIVD